MEIIVRRAIALVALLAAPLLALCQDNVRLQSLRDADQAPRSVSPAAQDKIDWKKLSLEDAERRTQVLAMLRSGQIKTANDFLNAALIFQHSEAAEDFRVAHSLATIATTLDPSIAHGHWLQAASWDRLVENYKQPQWYGTQYVKDSAGKWVLYQVLLGAITDAQRAQLGVPSLKQARAQEKQLNAGR